MKRKNVKLKKHINDSKSDNNSNFISNFVSNVKNSNLLNMICIDRIRREILIIFLSLPTNMELRNKQKHNSQLNYNTLLVDENNKSSVTNEFKIRFKSIDINNIYDIIPISTTSSSTSFWILDNSCIFESVSTSIISTLTVASS